MRTIKLKDDEFPSGDAGCVDWKTSPMEVLRQIDNMLAYHHLEIVILETNDDSYVWTIEEMEDDS